jgi:hypothetical protein
VYGVQRRNTRIWGPRRAEPRPRKHLSEVRLRQLGRLHQHQSTSTYVLVPVKEKTAQPHTHTHTFNLSNTLAGATFLGSIHDSNELIALYSMGEKLILEESRTDDSGKEYSRTY